LTKRALGALGGVEGFGMYLGVGWPKDLGDRGNLAKLRLCLMEYSLTPVSLIVIFCSLGLDEEALEVEPCCEMGDIESLLLGMMQSSFERIVL